MGLLRPNCLLVQHRPHQSSQLKAGHLEFFETLIPEYPKQEATLTCLEDLVDSYENGRAPRGGPIEGGPQPHGGVSRGGREPPSGPRVGGPANGEPEPVRVPRLGARGSTLRA